MTDYYKILGIEESASFEEIKKAYRKLSLKFHPDKNNGDVFFENMFKQIQEAYDVLSDSEKRSDYDSKYNYQSFNQNNTYSNFEPEIYYFVSNKKLFYSGDEITFEWKTFDADLVEIQPFGKVSINGNKTFKLNNINRQFITIELKATNTNISRYVTKQITLENKLFRDAKSQSMHKGVFSSTYQKSNSNNVNQIITESFWSVKGRLRRKDYLIRSILFAISLVIVIDISKNSNDEEFLMILIIGFMIIYAIQGIKRLHDLNLSGWLYLIILIPVLNSLFELYLLFADGTVGTNKYGPDPKNR